MKTAFFIALIVHAAALSAALEAQVAADAAAPGPGAPAAFLAMVARERARLLELAAATDALGPERREDLLALLVASPPPPGLSESGRTRLLNGVFALGRWPAGFARDTGFIEDDAALRAIAAALDDDAPAVREIAAGYLLRHGRPDRLAALAGLDAVVRRRRPPGAAHLEALLPLDAEARAALRRDPALADEIAARLGDEDAARRLLGAFEGAAGFDAKRSLARRLGYAGTPACARALLASQDTPIVLRTPYEAVSLRFELLSALGRIHPAEPVFTTGLLAAFRSGDDAGAAALLAGARAFAASRYGLAVPEPLGEVLIRRRRVP